MDWLAPEAAKLSGGAVAGVVADAAADAGYRAGACQAHPRMEAIVTVGDRFTAPRTSTSCASLWSVAS